MKVVTAWRDNAELIAAVFAEILPAAGLYVPGDTVLDVTYGDGTWWKEFQPDNFVFHTRRTDPGFDYRILPYDVDAVDLTAYDPPYAAQGGRDTSTIDLDRYGREDCPERPADLLGMNIAGLVECFRVSRRCVLMKSMDFVTGGELHLHTRHLEDVAEMMGWAVYERLVHDPTGGRPQPPGRAELHAQRRHSTLSILTPYKYRKGIKNRKAAPALNLGGAA